MGGLPATTAAAVGVADGVMQEPTPPEASQEKHSPQDGEELPSRPPPKKRRRIVISCTECHRRKQKCDRGLPCANCVSRNKQGACHYETGAPTAKKQNGSDSTDAGAARVSTSASPSDDTKALENASSLGADFGYSHAGASTLGFLKQIDNVNPGQSLAQLASGGADAVQQQQNGAFGLRERYKSLIRQLPARTYIDKLVELYFREFNWQYYALEYDVFMAQLEEWNSLPFHLLSTAGPHALSPDLRAFPALLFQTLAISLLVLPKGPHPDFDALKYAGNMTFDDLAIDYSESGVAILSLLGKRQMSLTTVLAGFLRVSFVKYTASVTESWHAIGSAIRDAQEIGIHRDSLDPKPRSDDAEAVLENQWEIQRRRRMWMILVTWDLHMGIILGRPLTIDNPHNATMPVDAPIPKNTSKTPVRPRGEDDPPTPLTRAIWYSKLLSPLRNIHDLEREGPCPKSFAKIDQLHEQLLAIEESLPPYLRPENPDTRFDSRPDCSWLPLSRPILQQVIAFDFMALHRPYIFTRAKNRTQALKFSLALLQAHRTQFQDLRPEQYRNFSLFFGTFDGIVLMASIYILFPKEHPELLQDAKQQFAWAVERFEAISDRNTLAKAALSVLHAIYIRLKKALGRNGDWPGKTTPPPLDARLTTSITASTAADTSLPTDQNTSSGVDSDTPAVAWPATLSALSNGGSGEAEGLFPVVQQPSEGLDFSLPPDFDWSAIQPIYAMGDIAYNDLTGIGGGGVGDGASTAMSSWDGAGENGSGPGSGGGNGSAGLPWQFDGNFNDNSVWNLFNEYTP